jgi:hypothetical protein
MLIEDESAKGSKLKQVLWVNSSLVADSWDVGGVLSNRPYSGASLILDHKHQHYERRRRWKGKNQEAI